MRTKNNIKFQTNFKHILQTLCTLNVHNNQSKKYHFIYLK